MHYRPIQRGTHGDGMLYVVCHIWSDEAAKTAGDLPVVESFAFPGWTPTETRLVRDRLGQLIDDATGRSITRTELTILNNAHNAALEAGTMPPPMPRLRTETVAADLAAALDIRVRRYWRARQASGQSWPRVHAASTLTPGLDPRGWAEVPLALNEGRTVAD